MCKATAYCNLSYSNCGKIYIAIVTTLYTDYIVKWTVANVIIY